MLNQIQMLNIQDMKFRSGNMGHQGKAKEPEWNSTSGLSGYIGHKGKFRP